MAVLFLQGLSSGSWNEVPGRPFSIGQVFALFPAKEPYLLIAAYILWWTNIIWNEFKILCYLKSCYALAERPKQILHIEHMAKKLDSRSKIQRGRYKLWFRQKNSPGDTVMLYHASGFCRNSNATDVDEWPNTAQMANCHLNVKISGSKAETIIPLTSLKDPRAVHQTGVSHHSTVSGSQRASRLFLPRGAWNIHWLSLCDRFNIFNVTSKTQDESSTFKFTNRIRDFWSFRTLKRSSNPSLGLHTGPHLPSQTWKSHWF